MTKYLFLFLLFFSNAFSQWSNNTSVNNPLVIAPFNQLNAKCISDGDDGIIIVWEDNRTQSSGNRDVYAQRVNKSGVKQWGDVIVVVKRVNFKPALQHSKSGS